MPAFAVFAPVGAFLFARRPSFGATARAEDYFRFEVVAVPDFPCFDAFRELVLLLFLLVVPHQTSPRVRAFSRASTCLVMLSKYARRIWCSVSC